MEQKVSLKDVLNYEPEMYYTPAELAFIRQTFKGNKALFKVLRKALIPTISDPEMPLEKMGDDFFLSARNWDQIPEGERGTLVVARQEALKFIVGGLVALQILANDAPKEASPKDSAK
jgi:hypothetical protein